MSTLRNRTKAEPQRSGMTHAKWLAVQALQPTERMLHESVRVHIYPGHRGKDGSFIPEFTRREVTGGTYNVGRNAAKRDFIRVLAEAVAESNRLMRAA